MLKFLLLFGAVFLASTNASATKKLTLVERGVDPRDIFEIDGVEYYGSQNNLSAAEHIKNCNGFGYKPVSLDTLEKNQKFRDFLKTWYPENGRTFWLSGRRLLRTYMWSGKGTFITETDWAEGQPTYSGSEDACIALDNDFGWILIGCSTPFRALCEK